MRIASKVIIQYYDIGSNTIEVSFPLSSESLHQRQPALGEEIMEGFRFQPFQDQDQEERRLMEKEICLMCHHELVMVASG